MRLRPINRLTPIVALLAVLFAGAPASAVGYWNLPGNFCQCAGYGWGAGHHACLVLGPITCRDCCAHHEVRLPCAPQPPHACYGCNSYNYDFRQPAQLAPAEYLPSPSVVVPTHEEPAAEMVSPTLTPDPLLMPEAPAPPRAIFEPPVEQ